MYYSEHHGLGASMSTKNINKASSEYEGDMSTLKHNKKLWAKNKLKPKEKKKKEGKIVDWLKE